MPELSATFVLTIKSTKASTVGFDMFFSRRRRIWQQNRFTGASILSKRWIEHHGWRGHLYIAQYDPETWYFCFPFLSICWKTIILDKLGEEKKARSAASSAAYIFSQVSRHPFGHRGTVELMFCCAVLKGNIWEYCFFFTKFPFFFTLLYKFVYSYWFSPIDLHFSWLTLD